jgi:hypothetical protein
LAGGFLSLFLLSSSTFLNRFHFIYYVIFHKALLVIVILILSYLWFILKFLK